MTDVGEALDRDPAEPRGVLHNGLDRLKQLELRTLALAYVQQNTQNTRLLVDDHGLRRE